MGALTSVACTSCLLSARSSGIFRIGRAFGLAIARLRRSAGFVAVATVLRHLRHIGLAVLIGRLRLQGGFSIFAWVRGHVIWPMRSAFVSGQARGSYPRRSLLPDRPRFGAAPARGCYLDPVRGALEGTQSGKECSSSAAVEIAFVPSWQARVGACVEVSQVGARCFAGCEQAVQAVERDRRAGLGKEQGGKRLEREQRWWALGGWLSC